MTDTTLPEAQNQAPAPADETNLAPPAESVTSDAAPEPAAGSEAPAQNGEMAAPPAAEDAPETTEPAAKPRKSAEDRIREAIAEREFWKRQALSGTTPAKPESAAPPQPELKRPALEDFETVDAWAAAYDAYSEQRAAKVVEQHLGKVREREVVQTVQEQFNARQESYAASVPDYIEVVSDPSIAPYVTPVISEAIVTSELGPQLSYYLGLPANRNELVQISRMRPAQQGVALGKLEARLAAQSKPAPAAAPAKPKPVQQTRAPAPPSPVGGQSPSKSIEGMSINEYLAARTWR